MIYRLFSALPLHVDTTDIWNDSNLYMIDWKDVNNGDVELSNEINPEMNHVHIANPHCLTIIFDAFPENTFPSKKKGQQNQQCECVLFPENCDKEEWILFIETKYAKRIESAMDERNNYPMKAINQIKETVLKFREMGIIDQNKVVNAIISFPNLLEEFNSWVLDTNRLGEDFNILDLQLDYGIIIRGTNCVNIKSDKDLFLSKLNEIE